MARANVRSIIQHARAPIFTIPPTAPFLPRLIRALLEGELIEGFPTQGDPLALSAATLYLPTRRACRLARDVFLDVIGEGAAILPRIVALGDVDEDESRLRSGGGRAWSTILNLKPAIGELERRLLLARLILKWAAGIAPDESGQACLVANNPVSAIALADDLARFIDDMRTRAIPWERLDQLVPEDFDRYWQLTLEFLKIAREAWPAILSERGAIETSERRDALIGAEAARLMRAAPGPVIAAGSTASMPATAELITAIAKLPNGAVVLPGLDTELDEESWRLIGSGSDDIAHERAPSAVGHPQFAMHALLARIGITRGEVRRLGHNGGADAVRYNANRARERYISEALRPAAATERWQQLADANTWLPPALESSEPDRGGECRRRGARDCRRAARGGRGSKDRCIDHARSRACTPCACRARPLEDCSR